MREGKWLFTGGKVFGHPTENFHPSMCTWRRTRRGIFHFPNHPRGKQYRFSSTIQYNKIHRNNNSTAEATTATAPNPSFMAFPFLPWLAELGNSPSHPWYVWRPTSAPEEGTKKVSSSLQFSAKFVVGEWKELCNHPLHEFSWSWSLVRDYITNDSERTTRTFLGWGTFFNCSALATFIVFVLVAIIIIIVCSMYNRITFTSSLGGWK